MFRSARLFSGWLETMRRLTSCPMIALPLTISSGTTFPEGQGAERARGPRVAGQQGEHLRAKPDIIQVVISSDISMRRRTALLIRCSKDEAVAAREEARRAVTS